MSGNHPHARLFVYGSLLESRCQHEIVGREPRMRPATLTGFERRRERHFYIVANPCAETKGAILMDLNARDLSLLDRYEDVPNLYTRVIVTAHTAANGRVACWCYLPTTRLIAR